MAGGPNPVKTILVLGVAGLGGYFLYKEVIGAFNRIAEGGDLVTAVFKWKNNTSRAISVDFRLDLRRSVPLATWNEGEWFSGGELESGETSEEIEISKRIPSDWPSALNTPPSVTVDVRITARLLGNTVTVYNKDDYITVT